MAANNYNASFTFIPAPTLLDSFATATVKKNRTSISQRQLRLTIQTRFSHFILLCFICTRERRHFLIIFVVPAEQAMLLLFPYHLQYSQAATGRADNSQCYFPIVYDCIVGRPGRFSPSAVA